MTMSLQDKLKALIDMGLTQADCLRAFAQPDHWAVIEARGETDDDLEIDSAPLVSESDDGAWVGAWIWVAKPNIEKDTDQAAKSFHPLCTCGEGGLKACVAHD